MRRATIKVCAVPRAPMRKAAVEEYLEKHNLRQRIENALNSVLETPHLPADPIPAFVAALQKGTSPMSASLSMIDAALIQEAADLDASDTNRSNIKFSYLSQKIAKALLATSPTLAEMEKKYEELEPLMEKVLAKKEKEDAEAAAKAPAAAEAAEAAEPAPPP